MATLHISLHLCNFGDARVDDLKGRFPDRQLPLISVLSPVGGSVSSIDVQIEFMRQIS